MPRSAPPIAPDREQGPNTAPAGNAFLPPSDVQNEARRRLRRELRERRRLVPRGTISTSRRICLRLDHIPAVRRANHIGAYLAADGEADPAGIVQMAWRRGQQVWLPVIRPGNTMLFAAYREGDRLVRNRFGIPEPDLRRRDVLDPRELSVVLMPLVGFDATGNRLGMGGGFYDRTFAFVRSPRLRQPKLLGVAFETQRVPALPVAPWDVPVWCICTEHALYKPVSIDR